MLFSCCILGHPPLHVRVKMVYSLLYCILSESEKDHCVLRVSTLQPKPQLLPGVMQPQNSKARRLESHWPNHFQTFYVWNGIFHPKQIYPEDPPVKQRNIGPHKLE